MNSEFLKYLIAGIIILLVSFGIAYYLSKKIGKDPRNILPVNVANRIMVPLLIFLASLLLKIAILARLFYFEYTYEIVGSISTLGIILSVTWFLIGGLKIAKSRPMGGFCI